MCREKFNLKYNFCYYYFSVMKDMTSESPALFIYIFKRKTSRTNCQKWHLNLNQVNQSVSRPKSIEHEFRYMTNLLNLYNLLNTINPK